jgi:hypothetical protein
MDYKKNIIDSVYVLSFGRCKFKGNDTLISINNENSTLDTICYLLIDTNLNVLNQTYIPKQNNWNMMAVTDFLLFSNKIIILCDIATNMSLVTAINLSYNGLLLDSAKIFPFNNAYSSFAYKLTEDEFYYGIQTYSNNNISVYKIDTMLTILSNDTVPILRPFGNVGYINRFNNKFIVSEMHNISQSYYIGTGIYDLNFDTTYAFNYYTLGNPTYMSNAILSFDNIAISDNGNIYSGSTFHYDTDTQNVGITCFDTLLNIKWQRILANNKKKTSSGKIYPAPDGGCIFSILIADTVNNTTDGAIVWLNSAGNQVLSIPKNISVFNKAIIYPNPGQNELNITLPENYTETVFELYNATGVLCRQTKFNTENQNINTTALSQGIYLYRILQNGKVISSGKWVKNE